MIKRTRYKLYVEDESRLEKIVSLSAPIYVWILITVSVCIVLMFFGTLFLLLTPVHTILPGYMKASERAASEIQMMRLDSIRDVYEKNQLFLRNIVGILNPDESYPYDSISSYSKSSPSGHDSILNPSQEEAKFVNMMRQRNKYNISVIASLAAESLMFTFPSSDGIFRLATRESLRPEILIPQGGSVSSIADGTVIAVSQSIRDGGSSIIVQHAKGFLSRIGRLGDVFVSAGDKVTAGQIIAHTNQGNARKKEIIYLEMWHNGNPIIPYDYLGQRNISNRKHPVLSDEKLIDNK